MIAHATNDIITFKIPETNSNMYIKSYKDFSPLKDTIDKRKTIKYKCRACKREFTMSNRKVGMCPHCNSNQINEISVKLRIKV